MDSITPNTQQGKNDPTKFDNSRLKENLNFDKNALFDTFKKENLKVLLLTEKSQILIRGGITTIIAILLFFGILSVLLNDNQTKNIPTQNTGLQNSPTPQISPTSETRATIKTKVGKPDSTQSSNTSTLTPTIPKGTGPTQKTQIYNINENFKSLTFKATYNDPTLLVDFAVTDPKGNTYTIGDEAKYGNKLITEWGKTSRLIKIQNMTIEKGSWTIELFASKNVPIEITLTTTRL